MGTSLVTARPTTSVRPGASSIDWSPEVLSSLNTVRKYTPIVPGRNRVASRERARDRPQDGLRLRLGLGELARRIGVRDDAGPGLDHHALGTDQGAADRDRRVEGGRAPAHVSHGAGIGPAPLRLQGVDDLHRPYFRRPGHGPR